MDEEQNEIVCCWIIVLLWASIVARIEDYIVSKVLV